MSRQPKAIAALLLIALVTSACSFRVTKGNKEGEVDVATTTTQAAATGAGVLEGDGSDDSPNPDTTEPSQPAPPTGASESKLFWLEVTSGGQPVTSEDGLVAGTISSSGQQDTYEFQAEKGKDIVLQQAGGCSFAENQELPYMLSGATTRDGEFEIERSTGDCNSGRKIGVAKTGTVRFTVRSGPGGSTGSYSFRILFVEQPATLPIAIGTEVRPNTPAPGAGVLSNPAERDSYTFDVTAGSTYQIRGLGGCQPSNGGARFSFSVSGAAFASGTFAAASKGDCIETKNFVAKRTGQATMEVFNFAVMSSGEYSFVIEQA